MQTLIKTQSQVIRANARKLHELAIWFAEMAAAEYLEAGKKRWLEGSGSASTFGKYSQTLEVISTILETEVQTREEEKNRPAIERSKK